MKFDIHAAARKNTFIVAHRGTPGGNIPCNTIASYEIALAQGADMIEVDVDMTKDGVLILFHPGHESISINTPCNLHDMTWNEVSKLSLINMDRTDTQFGICRFDDFLEHFKGRCFINVDKFWGHPKEISEAIKAHGMMDQVLVKAPVTKEVLTILETLAPDVAFMPVVKGAHPFHEELIKRNIHYVGVEVLFDDERAEVASPEFIARMHRDGKLVWVNSIIYNVKRQLAAGHSDDTALTESTDKGWGWLVDRGFDIIQTDWPIMLIHYLKSVGKYEKH